MDHNRRTKPYPNFASRSSSWDHHNIDDESNNAFPKNMDAQSQDYSNIREIDHGKYNPEVQPGLSNPQIDPHGSTQQAPPIIYDPAGYSKKAPSQIKREEVIESARKGDQIYEDFSNKRKEKLRTTTVGPPKRLGGTDLSSKQIALNRKTQEDHAKRDKILENYNKRIKNEKAQKEQKEREEVEIKEKIRKAREIAVRNEDKEMIRAHSSDSQRREASLKYFDKVFN